MTTGPGKLTRLNEGGGRIACIKELGVSDASPGWNDALTAEMSQDDERSSSMLPQRNPRWVLHVKETPTI
jgi:hypothetical protein